MLDYVIIGAGPSGLCAAKTMLQCEPNADLQILDANTTIGGVWAQNKLYPGLKTNNLRGGIDYADFPMHDGFGIAHGQHVTGQAMHNYIKAYASEFDLLNRITLGVHVSEATKFDDDSGWKLTVTGLDVSELRTKKLVVATGVTNEPHQAVITGSEDFEGLLIHSAELGPNSKTITANPDIKTVAVLGGGKSAYDAVYMAATNGRQVEWIIRKSGKGPVWVFPTHTYLGPFRAWRERLTLTRLFTFFSPCFWYDGFTRIRNFFHQNSFGRRITRRFWVQIGAATLRDCGYAKDERLNILEPQTNPFFYGTSSGTLSYDTDFFDLIRSGRVRIHREDIDHLSTNSVTLSNSNTIPIDALITATGFSAKPTITFTPTTTHSDLGIPSTSLTTAQESFWSNLNDTATSQIRKVFPRLVEAPFVNAFSTTKRIYNPGIDANMHYTPWRLYRGIAPPGPTTRGDNSLVFIGMFSNIANTIRCEIQCLWAYAYMAGKLDIDTKEVFHDTALMQRWAEARSPFGHGRFFPDVVFDQVPYFDTLLRDLGLRFWRKGGLLKEVFVPYGQADYRGLVEEWLIKEGLEKK